MNAMKQKNSILFLAAGFVLGALFMSAQQDRRTAAIQAMMQADRDFDKATAAKGIDGWVSFFETDGKMFRPDGSVIVGHPGIRQLMGGLFGNPKNSLRWAPDGGDASEAGDFGYTIGTSTRQIYGADGKMTEGYGRYLTVWRKQRDGSWKVAIDIGSPRPKPAGPAQ
jgi:ketosteroid isomerase-like protein